MAPHFFSAFISLFMFVLSDVFAINNVFKSSLTFAIDDTYSMSDDIDQVKLGVNAIFDTVLRSNGTQIKNYILVTFNDNGFGDKGVIVRANTEDREEFRNALNLINVHGGGDCPEYSMAGLKKALEESLDRSYIYVFTDASAKDYYDYEEVKAFAQEKQCQIIFALTKACSVLESPLENQVYQFLAEATHGQVFNVRKKEVGKILEYAKKTVTGRRTTLVDKKLPPGKHNMTFNVDAIMGEIILSLASSASDDPSVTITAPNGNEVWKKMLFETDQVKVYSLDATTPGPHSVELNCKSETQAVISARSGIDFQHGFSAYKLPSLVDTSAIPAPGKSHLSIKLNEGDVDLKSVQILDMNDNVMLELPMEAVSKSDKFYTTPAFDPPNTMFKIAIIGYDPKTNSNITRNAPTPVEIFRPPPGKKIEDRIPLISLVERVEAKYDDPLQVVCKVNGYPQPSIVWRNKEKGTILPGEVSPLRLPYVYTSALSIEKVQENMTYECYASNSVGSGASQVRITTVVLDKFNILDTPPRIQVEYRKQAQISCLVDAYPPASITWFKGGVKLLPNENIKISDNKSVVMIERVTPEDAGRYACIARNKNKRKIIYKRVSVLGTEVPEIDKVTNDSTIRQGSIVELECRITKGIPKPTITWYHASSFNRMDELREWNDMQRIIVTVRDKFDAGSYLCEAKNAVGADYHEITLHLKYPPTIENGEKLINASSRVSIPCQADGGPKPHVTWYKDDIEITNSDKVDIYGDQTLRFVAQPSSVGYYKCTATNELGSATKTVKVDVVVPVSITPPEETKLSMREGRRLTVTCNAKGEPKPDIKWIFNTFHPSTPKTIRSTSKILTLNHIRVSDEGYYTCLASNTGGSMNITYEIHVLAPPSIEDTGDNRFEVVTGDFVLRIPCEASGSPTPTVTWMKDGLNLALGSTYYVNEGMLLIRDVPKYASGTYTCVAENSAGIDSRQYQVRVLDIPTPTLPTSYVILEEGKSAEINCTAPHDAISNLRWYKDETFIKSGKLTLANPKTSDSGDYTCRVSDFMKSVSNTTRVIVGSKPEFTFSEGDEEIEITEDSSVTLNCEHRGEPTPKVEWYRDDKKIEATGAEYQIPADKTLPGQYKCIVQNTIGRITKKFNIVLRDCSIDTKMLTNLHPLILTPSTNWPIISKYEDYMVLSRGEQFVLSCPTRFKIFPRKDLLAYCDGGINTILIHGKKYNYSDIQCTEEIKHIVQKSGSPCIGDNENTESISIGYDINKEIAEVYEICWNKTSESTIYAKHTMSISPTDNKDGTSWLDSDHFRINFEEAYDCSNQINMISGKLERWFHLDDRCCFSKRQLVSPKDVFIGPPQKSTFSYFNVVPHWSTCNTDNWDEVEKRVRNFAYKSASELKVWTGTKNNLSLRGSRGPISRIFTDGKSIEQPVSTFLWKVVQDSTTLSSVAIVQVNVPDLSPEDVSKYILCEDQCATMDWMSNPDWHDVRKGYTYCCSLDQFESAFGLTDIFMPGMTSLLKTYEYEFEPESSLTI